VNPATSEFDVSAFSVDNADFIIDLVNLARTFPERWVHFLSIYFARKHFLLIATEKSEAIAHCMCKEMPVIPVNKVVDRKE
jgi:hypothetical protein